MTDHSEAFVAIDTSKLRNAVAIAEAGRSGEVRFLGEIDNTPAAPRAVREIAWKAQNRLYGRYRALARRGKLKTVIVTAIARELAGFIWAINREIAPAVTR